MSHMIEEWDKESVMALMAVIALIVTDSGRSRDAETTAIVKKSQWAVTASESMSDVNDETPEEGQSITECKAKNAIAMFGLK